MIQLKQLLTGLLTMTVLSASAQKTFECSGFKLESEGKKICAYTQSGMDIEGYIAIRQDSIIYTEVKSKAGELYRMFKYQLYIGDIEFSDAYKQLGFHDMKKGDKTLKHVSFYCAGRAQICFRDEVFCKMGRVGEGRSAALETYFDNGEEGGAFFADIQGRREKMGTRSSSSAAPATANAKDDDKGLNPGHPFVNVVNKTGHDIYVKVDGGASSTKLLPNAKTTVNYNIYGGQEYVECDRNNKKIRTLFNVSKELAKKGDFIIQ